jgi:hypothetical protein
MRRAKRNSTLAPRSPIGGHFERGVKGVLLSFGWKFQFSELEKSLHSSLRPAATECKKRGVGYFIRAKTDIHIVK